MIEDKFIIHRDASKAVVNDDKTALEEYKARKAKNKEFTSMKTRLNILEERVKSLEELIGRLNADC